jgi:hypothetical protein
LASGSKQGYNFFLVATNPDASGHDQSFEASACAATFQVTGVRCFFVDTSGVIRAADPGAQVAGGALWDGSAESALE